MLIYHTFQGKSVHVFVECIICFSEFKEASSFQLVPLTPEASPNTKKLKRAHIKSFQHFDTLDSHTLDSMVALIS